MCGFEPGSVKCFVESKPNYDAYKQSNFCWKKNLTKQVEQSKDIRKSLMYHRKSTEGDDFDANDDVPSTTIALLTMYDDDDEYVEWADETDRMCDVTASRFVDDVIDEMREGGEFDRPPPPIVERQMEPFKPVFNRTMREMKQMLRFVEEKKREERLEQKRLKEEQLMREEEERLKELRALQEEEEGEEDASQRQETGEELQNEDMSENAEKDYDMEDQEETIDEDDEDDDEASSLPEQKAADGIVPEPSTGVQLLEKLILDDDEYTSQFDSDVETLKISLARSAQIDNDDKVFTSSSRTSHNNSRKKSTGSQRALYPVSKAFKASKESRIRLPSITSVHTSASSVHSGQPASHTVRRVSSGDIARRAKRAAKAYQASIVRNKKRSEARNARESSSSSHKMKGRPDWSNSTSKPDHSSRRQSNGDSDRENFEQTLRLARVAYQTSSSSSFSKLSRRGRSTTGARIKSAPAAQRSSLAPEHSYSTESFEEISSSDRETSSSSSSGESEMDRQDSKRDSIVRFESAASGLVLRALDVNTITSSASRSSVASPTNDRRRRRRRNALSSSKLSDRPRRRSAMTSCLSEVTSRYSDVTAMSSLHFSASDASKKAINRRFASRSKNASPDQSSCDDGTVHCSSGSISEVSSIEECCSGY